MFGVVSLTMGNSLLPFAHCRDGDAHRLGELLLRQPLLLAVKTDLICNTVFHPVLLSRPSGRLFFCCDLSIASGAEKGQQSVVESVEISFNRRLNRAVSRQE